MHFLFSFLLLTSCATENAVRQDSRILFVGNSLTYVNDLPVLIAELGKLDGKNISNTTFLLPDYSLEDHWNEGKVQKEIAKGGYDFVVAQQGPSALPESQVLLLEYATRFAGVCRTNKTKLALYMVWPSLDRSFDLDNVILSYTNAARSTQSLLCPAGLAWKNAWQSDPTLPLYSPDNFHPGMAGSVLAALTIYGALYNKSDFDFVDYGKASWQNEISLERFSLLKQSALKALGR